MHKTEKKDIRAGGGPRQGSKAIQAEHSIRHDVWVRKEDGSSNLRTWFLTMPCFASWGGNFFSLSNAVNFGMCGKWIDRLGGEKSHKRNRAGIIFVRSD